MIVVAWLACGAAPPATPTPDPARAAELRDGAVAAYHARDFAGCADRYAEALRLAPETPGDAYDAACCNALAARQDEAFARLRAAADAGFRDPAHLAADEDLRSLREDPRWAPVAAQVKANADRWLTSIDRELYDLYTADQADRRTPDIDWDVVSRRDDERRARVATILAEGRAKASADWYHAAMVYQHGADAADARQAHELAMRALAIEPVYEPARWLAAAAEDRLLMREGKPQKWGTQFHKPSADALWQLWEVDPTITDEERARWNVPPIAEARARLEAMNRP